MKKRVLSLLVLFAFLMIGTYSCSSSLIDDGFNKELQKKELQKANQNSLIVEDEFDG